MGLDNVSQNVLGLVALFVSFVALVSTVLQVLQQYYSDAEGYRRCADSVMGLVCLPFDSQLRREYLRSSRWSSSFLLNQAQKRNANILPSGPKVHADEFDGANSDLKSSSKRPLSFCLALTTSAVQSRIEIFITLTEQMNLI